MNDIWELIKFILMVIGALSIMTCAFLMLMVAVGWLMDRRTKNASAPDLVSDFDRIWKGHHAPRE